MDLQIRKYLLIIPALVVTATIGAYAQKDDGEVRVINDPLFWKTDLRLSKHQIAGIDSANAVFYSSLKTVIARDQSERSNDLSALLQTRSTTIWNLLSQRQKAKWRRIEAAKYTAKGTRKFLHRLV